MPFVITGTLHDETFRATRLQPASAALVAMKLVERGYMNVLIADGLELGVALDAFRRKHLAGNPKIRMRGSS